MIATLTDTQVRYVAGDARWNIAPEGKKFRCKMIEPGLVSYVDQGGGIELLRKETIEKCLNSILGNPVTIGHVNVSESNRTEIENGVVEGAEPTAADDGWFYVYGTVDTEQAKSLIRRGQAPSCAYRVTSFGPGGVYHGIRYDKEITGLEFEHLAIVEKPRYEGSQFRLNSLTLAVSTMNVLKFLRKFVTRENGADGKTVEVEKTETHEIPLDTELDIDGKKVRFNALLDLWKQGTQSVLTASMESEVEVGGEKYKMNELIECYKNSKTARENALKAEADKAAETARLNALSDEEKKAEKEKQEKKTNSFFTLHTARERVQTDGGYSTSSNSLKEKVERGSKKY